MVYYILKSVTSYSFGLVCACFHKHVWFLWVYDLVWVLWLWLWSRLWLRLWLCFWLQLWWWGWQLAYCQLFSLYPHHHVVWFPCLPTLSYEKSYVSLPFNNGLVNLWLGTSCLYSSSFVVNFFGSIILGFGTFGTFKHLVESGCCFPVGSMTSRRKHSKKSPWFLV